MHDDAARAMCLFLDIRRFYIFCPNCGKEIADDAVICIGCGRSVNGSGAAVAAGTTVSTPAAPAGKFNPMAFLFNTSYYAGYGKIGKAMLLAVVGFIPLTLIPVAISFPLGESCWRRRVSSFSNNRCSISTKELIITYGGFIDDHD